MFRDSVELFGPSSIIRPPVGVRRAAEPPREQETSIPQVEADRQPPPPEPLLKSNAGIRAGLANLFARFSDLPAQSAVLGVSADGLPVLLDLHDPGPGALLVMGDERDAQVDLLRSVIASTALRNSPRGVQFTIFSHQPESWKTWMDENGFSRHCLSIVGPEEEQVREWVLRLADWTEQRRLGQRSGPPVMLMMDTLNFLPRLGYDVRLNFEWMAKEGPAAQIWPVAAISTDLVDALGSRMLRCFSSKIVGFTRDLEKTTRLVGDLPSGMDISRGSFAVQVGEDWLQFRLPS